MNEKSMLVGNSHDDLSYMSNKLSLIHVMAMLGWPTLPVVSKDVDVQELKKEYDLVQQKKSKLSASQRRWIVRMYEKYKEEEKDEQT